MSGKPYSLTPEEIEFICDPLVTAREVSERIGCGSATVTRWRKRFGWEGTSGLKKGPHPWKIKHHPRPCHIEGCDESVTYPQKYCSRKCMYSCHEYHENLKAKKKSHTKPGLRKDTTPEFVRYRNTVHRLSNKVYHENRDLINPNNHPRTLAGVEGGYQLDHIYTVKDGFENDVPPEQLSVLENLRVIPWKDNLARNRRTKLS